MTTTSTTTQALPGIDLDKLEALASELRGIRRFGSGHFDPLRELADGTAALIAQARAAQPRYGLDEAIAEARRQYGNLENVRSVLDFITKRAAQAAVPVVAADERSLFEAAWRAKFNMPDSMPFAAWNDGSYKAPAINDCYDGWRMARAATSEAAHGDLSYLLEYIPVGAVRDEAKRKLAALVTPPAPAQPAGAARPELTVWYGSMPESNGAQNFTATLKRKGASFFDTDSYTFCRSEYPDRVRYEADCMRFLIGELTERPDILAYDADKHSGYVEPTATAATTSEDARDAALEQAAKLCDEMEQHYSDYKDAALLNGDVELSNAAAGEPRACRFLAERIRALKSDSAMRASQQEGGK